jgi:hypothetical protein
VSDSVLPIEKIKIKVAMRKGSRVIPAAGDHSLWPWRNVQSCDRDVAPHGREVGDHGLCPWGSIDRRFPFSYIQPIQNKVLRKRELI